MTMRKLLTFLTAVCASVVTYAQTCPTPTTTGVHITLDSTYQLGTYSEGQTSVGLCFYNSTSTDITATQFRVFYDNSAFSGVDTITSLNTSFSQYLQYVDNPSGGYVTITFTYTGTNSSFDIPNGSLFEITFNHTSALSTTYFNVSDMTFAGSSSFSETATQQDGNDYTLALTNFGGEFITPKMSFHGTFTNVTGSGAKNLTVALEKKLKTSSTWSHVIDTLTNTSGKFYFTDVNIDTTAWNVRIKVQGDTMNVGNIVSVSDAQKVNQFVLGTATPTGFDFYTADANGDGDITISDVYSIYARVGGRFTAWPNSTEDVLFFTAAEYAAIDGSTSSLQSTYAGVTNFTFDIIPGQPDSVTYYVAAIGDANETGFKMARLIPIEIVNPNNAPNYIIDETVIYDEYKETIELNLPKINVSEGNLVNVPLKLKTGDIDLGSLQFSLKYDSDILEFKGIRTEDNSSVWMSFINTQDNIVEWGGFDPSNNQFLAKNGELFFTLQFSTKKPKEEWGVSPLYVTRKFAGDENATDLNITPTDGIVQVLKTSGSALGGKDIVVYPNPTDGMIQIEFVVLQDGKTTLGIYDVSGKKCIEVLDDKFPLGQYHYTVDLGSLTAGTYTAILRNEDEENSVRVVKIK